MSWTKREIINAAYELIGLGSYSFDIPPEQFEVSRRKLDAMMALWNGMGIRIGYPLSSTADGSDLDDKTTMTDMGVEAVYSNLSLRIAPAYGKIVSPDVMKIANLSLKTLIQIATGAPSQQQYPVGLPQGAGYKGRSRIFTPAPQSSVDAGLDTQLDFN